MKKYVCIVFAFCIAESWACDSHKTAVFPVENSANKAWSAGISGQSSRYDRDGDGPSFDSFTTQLSASRRFGESWMIQLGVPFHDRELDDESESGWGDASVTAAVNLFRDASENPSFIDAYAGVKMPTGDSDRLAEEQKANHHADAEHAKHRMARHGGEMHGESEPMDQHMSHDSHAAGHHLALGSGSWDFFTGITMRHHAGAWRFRAEVQYVIRTEGDYEYRYGNEFFARGGVYRAVNFGTLDCRLGLSVSAEQRDANEMDGVKSGPDKNDAYAGPEAMVRWNEWLDVMLAYDFPVAHEDDGLAGSADHRARFGAAISF